MFLTLRLCQNPLIIHKIPTTPTDPLVRYINIACGRITGTNHIKEQREVHGGVIIYYTSARLTAQMENLCWL